MCAMDFMQDSADRDTRQEVRHVAKWAVAREEEMVDINEMTLQVPVEAPPDH